MMLELREITYCAIVLRILTAVVLGGVLGLERELKNRPAGLRTYILVCVGSCMIMLTNQYIYQAFGSGDPVRMGAQVVSGIGFLGAGTIIVTKRNQIKGLTTAAGMWTAAAVGLTLGIGFYEAALFGGVIIFVTLNIMQHWDDKLRRKAKILELYVELANTVSLGSFMQQVRELDVQFDSIQLDSGESAEGGVRSYIAIVRARGRVDHDVLTDNIRRIAGVVYLEEL